MMNLQLLITLLIIAAALAFAGVTVGRRVRSFSPKKKCDADCGCDSPRKT
jgi:hypothetical protein